METETWIEFVDDVECGWCGDPHMAAHAYDCPNYDPFYVEAWNER